MVSFWDGHAEVSCVWGLQESNTPLHLAAFHGNLEGVKAMVEVR